jgi:uncharacterized delta-60 repeat protein
MKILFKNLIQFRFLSKVKHFSTTLVLTILLANLQIPSWAADGDLDSGFDTDGKQTTSFEASDDVGRAMAIQSDGKIVVAGYSDQGPSYAFAIARFNVDGSLDTSFSGDGLQTTDFTSSTDIAFGVAIQSDGKIVAVGFANNTLLFTGNDFAVARYNTDGSLDTTFDSDGKLTTEVVGGSGAGDQARSVVIQSDGKIVVGGVTGQGGFFDEKFAVVRYTSSGALDTTFDSDGKQTTAIGSGNDGAYAVLVQSDGKIIAAGESVNGSYTDFAVVRYTSTGALDTTFDSDGKTTTAFGAREEVGRGAVLQSDGKIVVAGYASNGTNQDFAVARYNTNGSLDTSFDTDGKQTTALGSNDDIGQGVTLQSDGKIILAGQSSNGSNADFAVTRYNSDGTLDTTFGTNGKLITPLGSGDESAYSVLVQSNGYIVVAGYFYNGVNQDFAVVRYKVSTASSDSISDFTFPWVGDQLIDCPNPNPWVEEQLGFASNANPVLVSAENIVGKFITQSSYDSLKSSGVIFDTVSKKVSTATETLPIYGCKDKLLSGKVNQPIQFIAGGYTLQSDAHGYINSADLKWHDINGVTLYTNTAAFMHTMKFTTPGKYVVVLTEQPDTSAGLIPSYGIRSIRFVININ